jgi:serine kinase of HPr protein (carbohydrate metabolism regulator)
VTAGLFNPIHPWTVQVLGDAGGTWLAGLKPATRAALPKRLRAAGMTTLIVARGGQLKDPRPWSAARIDIQYDATPAHELVHTLRRNAALAGRHAVVHGVFLHVHGAGVLIEAPAGTGKGALALELIARGHALVADDAVEFHRPARSIVVGRCPPVIAGYLETRDLGVLDVRRMHGPGAVRALARLDLIVRLQRGRPRAPTATERLRGRRGTRRVLGEPVPVLTLPLRHNLAALVEAACLDRRLQLDGLDAPAALERRQARAIRKET